MARDGWKMLALAAVLVALPAFAHEEGDRAMGIVESISAEQIVVKATDGHSVAFAITRDTRFVRGKEAARATDVRVGERAVVNGYRAGERLEAALVKLAPRPASR